MSADPDDQTGARAAVERTDQAVADLHALLLDEQRRRHDLDLVCIHEHAHAAMARMFGVYGHVTVNEIPDRGDSERFYIGRCRFYEPIRGIVKRRLVGLAGAVAEELFDNPDLQAFQLRKLLECGSIELSATDAVMVGAWRPCDLVTCLALVRELWPEIAQAAALHAQAGYLE